MFTVLPSIILRSSRASHSPPAPHPVLYCSLSIYSARARQWDNYRNSFFAVPTSNSKIFSFLSPRTQCNQILWLSGLADTSKTCTKQNKYSPEEWKRQDLQLPLHPLHIQWVQDQVNSWAAPGRNSSKGSQVSFGGVYAHDPTTQEARLKTQRSSKPQVDRN